MRRLNASERTLRQRLQQLRLAAAAHGRSVRQQVADFTRHVHHIRQQLPMANADANLIDVGARKPRQLPTLRQLGALSVVGALVTAAVTMMAALVGVIAALAIVARLLDVRIIPTTAGATT